MKQNHLASALLLPLWLASSTLIAAIPEGFSMHGAWGGSGLHGADPEVLSLRGTKAGDYVIWNPAIKSPAQVRISVYGVIESGVASRQQYEVHHDGKVTPVEVEFSGESGWFTLGTFSFSGTSDEYLKLNAVSPKGVRAAEAKFGILSDDRSRIERTIVVSQGVARSEVPPRPSPPGKAKLAPPPSETDPPVSELSVAPHIADSIVVQRDKPVVIVGKAPPGEEVTVSLAGNSVTVQGGGNFKAVLPPLPAGGPWELKVRCGSQEKVFRDIMVGDVWMIIGQSNILFGTASLDDAEEVLADSDYPGIRFFRGGEKSNGWVIAGPKTAGAFSAVGFLMARRLHKTLKVPVGIINPLPVGGDVGGYVSDEELIKLDPKIPFVPGGSKRRTLFSHDMSMMPGFPITGLLYYQGEGNSPTPLRHRDILPALVRDIRRLWGQGDFPFIYVQLPRYAPSFVAMREAQLLALNDITNSAMVISIDTGVKNLVHPGDKRLIGERAACAALALAYGVGGEYTGPLFAEFDVRDNSIFAKFKHTGSGLESRGALDGFEICGPDGVFQPAQAEIVGEDTVRVWSGSVNEPKAARYLWSGFPEHVGLYNKEGFPASPFRTDPLETDRIFDNRDANLLLRGEWKSQSGAEQAFGPDFLFDCTREIDGESNWLPWAKWMLSIVRTGTYGIYLRWPTDRPATATAEVKVIGAEVYPAVTISQVGPGGYWHKVGSFRLLYGDANSVKVVTTGNGVAVDSLKIVYED